MEVIPPRRPCVVLTGWQEWTPTTVRGELLGCLAKQARPLGSITDSPKWRQKTSKQTLKIIENYELYIYLPEMDKIAVES